MTKTQLTIALLFVFSPGCALFQTPLCDCKKQPIPTCETPQSPITLNPNADPGGEGTKEEVVIAIPSSEAARLSAFDPWDPRLNVDPNDKAILRHFSKYGPPLNAFQGEFGTKYGEEYVAVFKDKLVFLNGSWITAFDIGNLALANDLKTLNIGDPLPTNSKKNPPKSAMATDLLRDGVNEIGVIVATTNDPTKRVFRFQIYKTIGQHIAKIFDHPFAVRTAKGTRQVARIDFIEGAHSTRIRTTPLSEDGLLDLAHIKIYSWNQWEGMFRVPKKAPTSPQR